MQYALDAAEEIVELGLTDLKYDGIDSVLEKLENCNINDRDIVKRIVYAYDVEIYIKYIKRDVSIKETGKRYDNFLKRTSLNENEIQTLMMEMGHLSFHKTINTISHLKYRYNPLSACDAFDDCRGQFFDYKT